MPWKLGKCLVRNKLISEEMWEYIDHKTEVFSSAKLKTLACYLWFNYFTSQDVGQDMFSPGYYKCLTFLLCVFGKNMQGR